MTPTGGPKPKESFAEGFFEVAAGAEAQAEDAGHGAAPTPNSRATRWTARAPSIKQLGLKIVYDKTYPPATADYTPVVRAIAATNPDIFLACSYPADTVGLIRASHEVGFKPKVYGGGMVGLQATAIKTQLGPLLNGIVVYDFWLPWAGFASDEGREFVKKYQTKSAAAGVDLLGYYLPPFAYARMQVIEQAVKGAGGTDDAKLAEYVAQDHLQDRGRRHQVQRRGRMGDGAGHGRAVPGRQGQRRRPVQGSQDRSDPVADQVQDRQHHLSVRPEEVTRAVGSRSWRSSVGAEAHGITGKRSRPRP